MSNNTEVQDFTIEKLLTKDKYIIPIYQRNYDWDQKEIGQLIQDIWDYADAEKNKEDQQPYYIGTLVTYLIENNKYEVLDGQQRLTTLYIVCAVLKHLKQEDQAIQEISKELNLCFEAREGSSKTLKNILDENSLQNILNGNLEDEKQSIIDGFKDCHAYFKNLGNNIDLEKFTGYFLNNVILVRTVVPKDTELNHYFEIMNNRGEQLEKHEILKARLLQKIDEEARNKYATIWDACSQMNSYVQMNFNTKDRENLFGEDWDRDSLDIDKYLKENEDKEHKNNEETKANTITKILEQRKKYENNENKNDTEEIERFESVIDFPNFLLQVLKATEQDKDISLDDKKLLEEFKKFEEYEEFPEKFITNLLAYRFWFDKNIIKRQTVDSKDSWSLQTLNCENKNQNYTNTSLENHINILMIQSMFHVSFTAKTNKNWLQNIFEKCYQEDNMNIETLEGIARVRVNDIEIDRLCYGGKDNHPTRYLFHLIDYLIWRKDKDKKFSFKIRNSIEHFLPQDPGYSKEIDLENSDDNRHSFGNLALVTRGQNSRFSNHSPQEKANKIGSSITEQSLKFQLMLEEAKDWNAEKIKAHQEKMSELLKNFQNQKEQK